MKTKFIVTESQIKKIYSLINEQTSQVKPSTQPQTKRQGTRVDGIIGEFTSKFIFPTAFMKYFESGDVENLGIKGNQALVDIAQSNKLSIEQMNAWNQFQKYLQTNGVAGISSMNNIAYSDKWWNAYRKSVPNFWVKTKDDVKKVQAAMQLYRAFILKDFTACRKDTSGRVVSSNITIGGKPQDCTKPEDIKNVQQNFMAWAKPESFKQ